MTVRPLQVCIDGRFTPGSGGVERYVVGLLQGLSRQVDEDVELSVLTTRASEKRIRAIGLNDIRILRASENRRLKVRARSLVATALWRYFPSIHRRFSGRSVADIPVSDGVIEAAGCDVIHFAHQLGFLTSVPSIYQPHDLQHVHLPESFSRGAIAGRDHTYRTLCDQARMIAVVSNWVKSDLVQQYGIAEERILVIPYAPPTSDQPVPTEVDLAATRDKLKLPEKFLLYPAQLWRHKNHLMLFEALAQIKAKPGGPRIALICTGGKGEYLSTLRERLNELDLDGQVSFFGYLAPLELRSLFRLARALVMPTLFEAASFPIWEAFESGTAVACSNVTSLPEQVGDAALIFEPRDATSIAESIERLWSDDECVAQLALRGAARVSHLSWDNTARLFIAAYKSVAQRPLSPDQEAAIAWASSTVDHFGGPISG